MCSIAVGIRESGDMSNEVGRVGQRIPARPVGDTNPSS